MVGLGGLKTHDSSSDVTRVKVDICQDAEGDFQATLVGHFTLRVKGDCVFRVRLLYLFLRLLEVPGETTGESGARRPINGPRAPEKSNRSYLRRQDQADSHQTPQARDETQSGLCGCQSRCRRHLL